MSRTLTFTRTASVTLDSNGNGTVSLGPSVPGEVWLPDSCSISATGSIPVTGTPVLFLYAGEGVSAGSFVDSTYNVTGASSSMISGKTLYPGQQVFAVWSGGPPGQVATLVVKGTRKVP
jgi:hypothetical protein